MSCRRGWWPDTDTDTHSGRLLYKHGIKKKRPLFDSALSMAVSLWCSVPLWKVWCGDQPTILVMMESGVLFLLFHPSTGHSFVARARAMHIQRVSVFESEGIYINTHISWLIPTIFDTDGGKEIVGGKWSQRLQQVQTLVCGATADKRIVFTDLHESWITCPAILWREEQNNCNLVTIPARIYNCGKSREAWNTSFSFQNCLIQSRWLPLSTIEAGTPVRGNEPWKEPWLSRTILGHCLFNGMKQELKNGEEKLLKIYRFSFLHLKLETSSRTDYSRKVGRRVNVWTLDTFRQVLWPLTSFLPSLILGNSKMLFFVHHYSNVFVHPFECLPHFQHETHNGAFLERISRYPFQAASPSFQKCIDGSGRYFSR